MKKVTIIIALLATFGTAKAQYDKSSLENLIVDEAKIVRKLEGVQFPPIFRIVNGNFEVNTSETKTGLFVATTWSFQGDSIVLLRTKNGKTKKLILHEWDRRVSYRDKQMMLATLKAYNTKNPKFLKTYL